VVGGYRRVDGAGLTAEPTRPSVGPTIVGGLWQRISGNPRVVALARSSGRGPNHRLDLQTVRFRPITLIRTGPCPSPLLPLAAADAIPSSPLTFRSHLFLR